MTVIPDSVSRNKPASREGGTAAATRSGAAGAPLPCQIENKCTKSTKKSSYHKKRKLSIRAAVEFLALKFGLGCLGFLTLTFADHVTCPKEAWRRFKSLRTHVLNRRYPQGWLCVMERQDSGRIHFHLLVVLPGDIRTGFDFAAVKRRCYVSANALIRGEWTFWRLNAKRYGFGRTELLPIESTGAKMASYVGKYLDKHHSNRLDIDKGAHLVSSSRGVLPSTRNFSSNTDGAQLFRRKKAVVAALYGFKDNADFRRRFGPKWGWAMMPAILGVDLLREGGGQVTYPNVRQAAMDGHSLPDDLGQVDGPITISRFSPPSDPSPPILLVGHLSRIPLGAPSFVAALLDDSGGCQDSGHLVSTPLRQS